MQLKGFIAGAAVVSLAWLGSTAWDNYSAEVRAGSMQRLAGVHAAHGMSEAEKEAHVAEMRRMWESMTPAQREAHRNMNYCPYSGRGAHGMTRDGSPGVLPAAPLRGERPQPLEI
jgi:hypothetical protein